VSQQTPVTGVAATWTTLAMGLGSAVVVGDFTVLSSNLATVQRGLQCSAGTTIFVACLASLTLAAAVLGAGVLGDKYGAKRMFVAGTCGAVVFGLLAAAAPSAAVLLIARACIGVSFAFLSSLSLAIINMVFPPDQRAAAIARYLAVVYAFGVAPPAIASLLVKYAGWRSGFLITPVLAIIVLVITLRYVPETQRTHRKTDIPGLLLVAVALIGLIYGISQLQTGLQFGSVAPILIGILAAAAFVWWELRADEPALDMRIFRSPRFDAALTAGAASNLIQGGAMMTLTYNLFIRGASAQTFALLIIPATLVSALAALGAGWAAARLGVRAVLVTGLTVVALSQLGRQWFEVGTPIVAVAAVMALTSMGGAIVQTPQTTILMSSAPTHLGGVVSAVKGSVAGTSYSLGAALFPLLGVALFNSDANLARAGISREQARDALRVARGLTSSSPSGGTLDPHRTEWVLSEATPIMFNAAHTLNLVMMVAPVTAIVLALVLLRREPAGPPE